MDASPISAALKKCAVKRDFPWSPKPISVVAPGSSGAESDSDSNSCDNEAFVMKKSKIEAGALPVGFLDPLSPEERIVMNESKKAKTAVKEENPAASDGAKAVVRGSCKQFWKAGDYEEEALVGGSSNQSGGGGGMDHLRVHPRFLHSNATSHKWALGALGALAELLDNSLDEVCNGATFVNVDVILNNKDTGKMLVVEDDGGGMTPDKLRQCMSLGYSLKSKLANTIGQYGNGFKTSTMRLGADVIVFSRCPSANGMTQSIGMLSYTFLRTTGKEDIVVPMVDFNKEGSNWKKLFRSCSSDWSRNLETILDWSPYKSEEELLEQFNAFKDHGTRIVIYNLWEDDEGKLELDFDTDEFDIQMRGENRDEQKIEMVKTCPNSKHFLTYRHSLRSYASILYLTIPQGYRMFLRGKEIEHHDVVTDLMLAKEISYKPLVTDPKIPKNDPNMVATGTIGFVKDAGAHFDIQGFNVYHKNRLIKPFWRVWNAAGSDGRGVIGVLEANFVEPAHDKQGFERTTALARLELRLKGFQKDFWNQNCHEIGYSVRRNKKAHALEAADKEKEKSSPPLTKASAKTNSSSNGNSKVKENSSPPEAQAAATHEAPPPAKTQKSNAVPIHDERTKVPIPEMGDVIMAEPISIWRPNSVVSEKKVVKFMEENQDKAVESLERSLEQVQNKCKELEKKLEVAEEENQTLIDVFSEERNRKEEEEDQLRKKLKEASNTIRELLEKVKSLESMIPK